MYSSYFGGIVVVGIPCVLGLCQVESCYSCNAGRTDYRGRCRVAKSSKKMNASTCSRSVDWCVCVCVCCHEMCGCGEILCS